jgi:excisionase family DNA binding protein
MAKRLLKPYEAAQELRVDMSTIYKHVREGKMPAVRVGRVIRVDIDRYLAKGGCAND